MSTYKFLVFGDLHGRIPEILTNKSYDAILCPGDICYDNVKDLYKDYFDSMRENDEKMPFSKFIETKYPNQDIEEFLESFKEKSIEKGDEVLKYLNSLNKPVFLVPGNWDPTDVQDGTPQDDGVWREIVSKYENIIDCEFEKYELDQYFEIIGYGSTSAPEVVSRDNLKHKMHSIIEHHIITQGDENEEELEEELDELYNKYLAQKKHLEDMYELFEKRDKNKFSIYISHNSPYNTSLDIINNEKSPIHGKHYGSVITREIIEKFSPELVICGHIHEGVGICEIDKTKCLNAGYGGKINHLITIDLDKKKIQSIKRFGENLVD